MSYYRTYRPQKLADLDNDEIRKRLEKIFSSTTVPHAFLFSGPKGIGKTSAARIVAKILLCTARKRSAGSIEPCNTCHACKAITQGSYVDVLEIDAASNRGIEEVRDLREKIKFSPIEGAYKIYIIDEVHMMTTDAFNALLKTLEEPPAHAFFILATTDPEKVPSTILSRCVNLVFTKATQENLLHSLSRVVKGEKIKIDALVLNEIARNADGSFRDATKLLEQVVLEGATAWNVFQKEFIKLVITPSEFLHLLHERKTVELLKILKEMDERGTDIRAFVAALLQNLHTWLLASFALADGDVKYSKEISDRPFLLSMIKQWSLVYPTLKGTFLPILQLEITVVNAGDKK